jgi:hypothetical protein
MKPELHIHIPRPCFFFFGSIIISKLLDSFMKIIEVILPSTFN